MKRFMVALLATLGLVVGGAVQAQATTTAPVSASSSSKVTQGQNVPTAGQIKAEQQRMKTQLTAKTKPGQVTPNDAIYYYWRCFEGGAWYGPNKCYGSLYRFNTYNSDFNMLDGWALQEEVTQNGPSITNLINWCYSIHPCQALADYTTVVLGNKVLGTVWTYFKQIFNDAYIEIGPYNY